MNREKLRLPSLFLTVILISFFFSQALFADNPSDDDQGNQADKPSTFVMSMRPARIDLNPLYSNSTIEGQIYTALYEGLVSYDPFTLRPVPGMAQNWEIDDSGTLYRFYINPAARYWNGDPVKASDFKNAWLKMLSLGEKAPFGFLLDPIAGAAEYRKGENTDPDSVGISAPSDNILEVRLKEPTSYFLSILAHQSLVAVHPSQIDTRDWTSFNSPLGSGPYYIIEKKPDALILARNELYWDQSHSEYDRIEIDFSSDSSGSTARFNSGEIQWMLSGFSYSDLKIPDSVQIAPQFATTYYFFSAAQAPYDDPRIRKALLLLLPLDQIRSPDVYFVPAETLIPQIPGYPDVTGLSAGNREEAMTLLKDAGYENGDGLPEIHIVLPDDDESRRIGSLMENAWKGSLNVPVKSDYLDYYGQQEAVQNGQFTIGSISWVGDYADPMSFLQLWTSDSTYNFADYNDEEFDRMVRESNSESGITRYKELATAEQHLLDSAIVLPVSHSPSINVIDLDVVGGWYPNPLDVHPFKYLYQIKLKPPANIALAGAASGADPE